MGIMSINKETALKEIEEALRLRSANPNDGLEFNRAISVMRAAIKRLAPPESTYLDDLERASELTESEKAHPARRAYDINSSKLHRHAAILEALKFAYDNDRIVQRHESDVPAFLHVSKILTRFHQVAKRLKVRHCNRDTLWITDEYDVQDLLGALLKIDFDDVRPEEWTPNYAGKASRMDFLIKAHKLVIETKMTRDRLTEKEIGDELLIDIARYKEHVDCNTLVCFIYDPEQKISNAAGLKYDLEKASTERLSVVVFVCQH
jgi:hypothetical protein